MIYPATPQQNHAWGDAFPSVWYSEYNGGVWSVWTAASQAPDIRWYSITPASASTRAIKLKVRGFDLQGKRDRNCERSG